MRLNQIAIILILGLLLFLIIALLSGTVLGQVTPDSAISWFVIASGGSSSIGGNVNLESTLGQSIAGSSESGNVFLGEGYWYAPTAVELYLPIVIR
jgi:hypothetical protein